MKKLNVAVDQARQGGGCNSKGGEEEVR